MKPNFFDAQTALGFLMPSFHNVEAEVYARKYPSFDYASLLPVITEGNEWAAGTVFRSSDIAGRADWLSGKGYDMPYADVTRGQHSHTYEMAGIGYEWTLEEMERASMEGRNLGTEKADAAKRIAEATLYGIAIEGDAEKGWTGLVNDPAVPAADAAATGSGSSTEWSSKTPDNILSDVNGAITGVYTSTGETEAANTVLLPTAKYQYLATTPRSGNSDTSILSYLLANNAYTAETGQPLLIRGTRALNGKGQGGSDRMVTYRRARDVVRFHLPMPHKFLAPFQKSSMTWEVAGIMRTGGTEVRLPKAVSYIDGI